MELFIAAAVIALLLLVLGNGLGLTLIVLSAALFLVSAALLAVFLFCLTEIIFSRRVKGRFVRCEKKDSYKFSVAVYETADGEVANTFPCEMKMLRKFFYRPEKDTVLFYVKRRNKVYDGISLVTTVVGAVSGVIMFCVTAAVMKSMF